MRYECKYCGENQTGNVIQDMINNLIKSGRGYIDSSGNEGEYKEIKWCKCSKSKKMKNNRKFNHITLVANIIYISGFVTMVIFSILTAINS